MKSPRARPKSVTTARTPPGIEDKGTSITLPLLKSRWMICAACAASSAAAICSARRSTCSGGSLPWRTSCS
nr:hypothetical protein [Vitiosangium sp. GDMCC 1.1324]